MGFSFASGVTDKIDCGTSVTQSGVNRTYYARVKPNAANANRRCVMVWSNGSAFHAYLLFGSGATNQLEWGFSEGGLFPTVTWTTGWTAGSEHVVIATYDGSNLAIYADTDPVAKATLPTTSIPDTGAHSLWFGNNPAGSTESLDGELRESAWWASVAIGTSSRLILGNGGSPLLLPERPTEYWPLVRTAQAIRDAGNNGTVTGATVVDHGRVVMPDAADIAAVPTILLAAMPPPFARQGSQARALRM